MLLLIFACIEFARVGMMEAITEDAARRSVLNHRIQQLWLSQGGQ